MMHQPIKKKTFQCLVVDDELQARIVLKRHINQLDMLALAGECSHSLAAYEFLQTSPVDLMFLDIKMPQLNGLDFLRSLDKRPTVILTTAYRDYAFEGFELDVADYLLKPISFKRFLKSLQKAIQFPAHLFPEKQEKMLNQQPFMYFRVDRQMVKVFYKDIAYFESLKDYIRIVTPEHCMTTKMPLSKLEKMLPPNRFVRIHRSFIINPHYIVSYSTNKIKVQDQTITVGRMYKKNWENAIGFPKNT